MTPTSWLRNQANCVTHNGKSKDKCFNLTTTTTTIIIIIIIVYAPSDHVSLLSTPGKKGWPRSLPRINVTSSLRHFLHLGPLLPPHNSCISL